MKPSDKKKVMYKITILGSILDFFLGVIKVVMGVIFYSQSLIIDGIHSFSDIFTDLFVILVAKYSHDHPDEEHPYGHARFETLGTVVIGVSIIALAVFLVIDNVDIFIKGEVRPIPQWPTLLAALLSIIGKEWIYRKTLYVGEKLNSQLIIANAWHSRSDAFTSVLVFIGLIFAINGITVADLIVAIVLSIFIGKIGWDFVWKSIEELVDTSLAKDKRLEIEKLILSIDGVHGLHNLRSRKLGNNAILDVNIEVSPFISVSEGHEIASWVAKKVMDQFDYVYDVTVHTDVEDDRGESSAFAPHEYQLRPLRAEIMHHLKEILGNDLLEQIDEVHIHYLNRKVHLSLLLLNPQVKTEIDHKILESSLITNIRYLSKL